MSEWKKVKLGELYEVHNGLSKGRQFFGSGFPFLTFSNVFNNWFLPNELESLVQSSEKERQICSIERGDVFITRTSETMDELGMSSVALKDYPNATYNGFTKRLRPLTDEVIPEYIGYYLRSPKFRGKFMAFSTMTTRASLANDDLLSMEVDIPEKAIQQRIATILSRYDSLIENYQKQIKLLEESAQRLYKEWFIDLRFPGHENTKIVDGVPDGWVKICIDSLVGKLESGSRPKGGIDTSIKDGVASVGAENVIGLGQYNFSSEKLVSYDFYNNAKKGRIENKDILIYKDGAYIGRTSLFQNNFPHKEAMINEHVFLLHTKKEVNQYFLFFTLYQKVYFEKMQKLNKNAAQPGLNQNAIKSLKLLMPNEKLIVRFDEIISPMMKVLFDLANQIRHLTEARDRLLPKLMSGEIKV
jgi:type I restriction enzyme S subunit